MKHAASSGDLDFLRRFEACDVAADEFDHAAHVRLAYVYLCSGSVDDAASRMKDALLRFLEHLGADPTKYHETITRAWVMAVDHFMAQTGACASAVAFMSASPRLLDKKIMLTHYTAEVLFSSGARRAFITPDIQPIPP